MADKEPMRFGLAMAICGMLLMAHSLAPPIAHGKYNSGTRLSTNVEDRRFTGRPQEQLVRFGKAARAKTNDFLCPVLKEVVAQVWELGEQLEKVASSASMKDAYDTETTARVNGLQAEIPKSVNACAGAKQAQLKVLSTVVRNTEQHRLKHREAHEAPNRLASALIKHFETRGKALTVGDRVNDKLGPHCPDLRAKYLEALKEYEGQAVSLEYLYQGEIKSYRERIAQTHAIRCGQ
jgi:hypothetical protein